MTHFEHIRDLKARKRWTSSVECSAHHMTFGGRCLNCGYVPDAQRAKPRKYQREGYVIIPSPGYRERNRLGVIKARRERCAAHPVSVARMRSEISALSAQHLTESTSAISAEKST